jgi:apolipoprotein N-acyltransferase
MLSRLRQPGGWIGGLSMAGFFVLGILGVFGVVMLVIALIADQEWWSDQKSEQFFGLVIFALIALGAVGFLIMDQQVWLGTSLAVLGSLVFAVMIFWAILPVFLGLLFAVVAILRARELHRMPVQPPPAEAPA